MGDNLAAITAIGFVDERNKAVNRLQLRSRVVMAVLVAHLDADGIGIHAVGGVALPSDLPLQVVALALAVVATHAELRIVVARATPAGMM